LELVGADLFVPVPARLASATSSDEWHGDTISHCPVANASSDLDHRASELVPWNVGECDIRVVTHPAVPVASAQPGRFNPNDNSIGVRSRQGPIDYTDRPLEL
jgi:hypothetical protein